VIDITTKMSIYLDGTMMTEEIRYSLPPFFYHFQIFNKNNKKYYTKKVLKDNRKESNLINLESS